MSRNESRNESRLPRVRVLVFEAGSETPMHTLSLPAAASVFDLRSHIGLFGPQLWDPRFNGGVPVGDGVRLLDLENDEKEVRLEVRMPRVREPPAPVPGRPASEAMRADRKGSSRFSGAGASLHYGGKHASRSSSSKASVRPLALAVAAIVAGLIVWRALSASPRRPFPARRRGRSGL